MQIDCLWTVQDFNELSPETLYQILKLRVDIFMLEQNCLYPDLDGKDLSCRHLYAMHEGQVIAYVRLLPAGLSYPEASIGRVVVHPAYRKFKIGRELMERAIATLREPHKQPIQIGAQAYLYKFYNSLGFKRNSEEYLEDGILHIDMLLS